jgi:hypothetical protein
MLTNMLWSLACTYLWITYFWIIIWHGRHPASFVASAKGVNSTQAPLRIVWHDRHVASFRPLLVARHSGSSSQFGMAGISQVSFARPKASARFSSSLDSPTPADSDYWACCCGLRGHVIYFLPHNYTSWIKQLLQLVFLEGNLLILENFRI